MPSVRDTRNMTYHPIDAQPLCVVDIFVPGKATAIRPSLH